MKKTSLIIAVAAALAASALSAHASWTVLALPDATSGATTSMAHLPDGRFIYGHNGVLARQDAFGFAAATEYANAPSSADFAFVTPGHVGVYNAGTASYDSGNTATTFSVRDTSITSPYAGAAYGGGNLIMTGAVGFGASGIHHVSPAGVFTTLVSGFSEWSGGLAINPLATGSSAFLYVAYAGSNSLNNNIYSYSRDQVEASILGTTPLESVTPGLVGKLTDTSSLAYDPEQNRLYGAGYNDPNFLHTLDLDTNEKGKLALPGGAANTLVTTFSDGATNYVGWLSRDGYAGGDNVTYGYEAAAALPIPEPGAGMILSMVLGAVVLRRNRVAAP